MTEQIPVEKLTRVFIKIRDRRAQLKAAFEAEDEQLAAQADMVKAELLEYCKAHNVESVRTESGTFYRTVKTRYWTNDWEAMNKFIVANGLPEFFEKRLNQSVVRQFLEDNPDTVPPGLNSNAEYVITVRKA